MVPRCGVVNVVIIPWKIRNNQKDSWSARVLMSVKALCAPKWKSAI